MKIAEGNTSSWTTPNTLAATINGTYLRDNATAKGLWRTSAIPRSSANDAPSFALEPGGTVHAFTGQQSFQGRGHAVLRPGAAWTTDTLPRGLYRLAVAASRTADGVIAAANEQCVHIRVARGGWRTVGCLTVPPQPSGRPWGATRVRGPVIDRRGAVHVVFTGYERHLAPDLPRVDAVFHATNAGGTWRIRKVSDIHLFGTTLVAADPVTGELVLVIGEPDGQGGYRVRVAKKSARVANFGPLSTRYSVDDKDRAIVPTSVASFGGRITIAAQRIDVGDYGYDNTPWGPAVLLTGSNAANVGGLAEIPGARTSDAAPMLYARSKTEVLVGWNHVGFSTNEQGIWTAWRTYGPDGATTSRPTRRTRSAYDRLNGIGIDRRGNVYLLYRRQQLG